MNNNSRNKIENQEHVPSVNGNDNMNSAATPRNGSQVQIADLGGLLQYLQPIGRCFSCQRNIYVSSPEECESCFALFHSSCLVMTNNSFECPACKYVNEIGPDNEGEELYVESDIESDSGDTARGPLPDILKSKDGRIWNYKIPKTLSNIDFRYRSNYNHNVASNLNSILDTFHLFITKEIISDIATFTNMNGINTSPEEITKYIGLLMKLGLNFQRKQNVANIFQDFPDLRKHMARSRFEKIMRKMRLEDDDKIKEGRENNNKLILIKSTWKKFIKTISPFIPGPVLTLDEHMISVYSPNPLQISMSSKRNKTGIKIFMLCDANNRFVNQCRIFVPSMCEIEEESAAGFIHLGTSVKYKCKKMLESYYESGRTVIMDRFFTGVDSGEYLYKRKLYVVGTMLANRMGVPKQLTELREAPKVVYVNNGNSVLLSDMQKKNRNVLLYTTKRFSFDPNIPVNKKPEMLEYYDKYHGGVVNRMIENYSCRRSSHIWTNVLFFFMVDAAVINSYSLWSSTHKITRQNFIRELSEQLLNSSTERSMSSTNMSLSSSSASLIILQSSRKRGRCIKCLKMENRHTKRVENRCIGCNNYICSTHSFPCRKCHKCSSSTVSLTDLQSSQKRGRCVKCVEIESSPTKRAANRCICCNNYICSTHSLSCRKCHKCNCSTASLINLQSSRKRGRCMKCILIENRHTKPVENRCKCCNNYTCSTHSVTCRKCFKCNRVSVL